jgi:CheY-like chemotaxis protein
MPDLLVSDYRMPGMDGRQLVEKLKGRSATAAVFGGTAGDQIRHLEKLALQDHPADDFVGKPFF